MTRVPLALIPPFFVATCGTTSTIHDPAPETPSLAPDAGSSSSGPPPGSRLGANTPPPPFDVSAASRCRPAAGGRAGYGVRVRTDGMERASEVHFDSRPDVPLDPIPCLEAVVRAWTFAGLGGRNLSFRIFFDLEGVAHLGTGTLEGPCERSDHFHVCHREPGAPKAGRLTVRILFDEGGAPVSSTVASTDIDHPGFLSCYADRYLACKERRDGPPAVTIVDRTVVFDFSRL